MIQNDFPIGIVLIIMTFILSVILSIMCVYLIFINIYLLATVSEDYENKNTLLVYMSSIIYVGWAFSGIFILFFIILIIAITLYNSTPNFLLYSGYFTIVLFFICFLTIGVLAVLCSIFLSDENIINEKFNNKNSYKTCVTISIVSSIMVLIGIILIVFISIKVESKVESKTENVVNKK